MKKLDYFNKYWEIINNLDPNLKKKVIDLGMGMPTPNVFIIPSIILKKLRESVDKFDFTLYTKQEGNPELLNEIVEFENSNVEDKIYTKKNILLTPGAIAGFALVIELLAGKDGETVIFNPSYFSLASLSELKTKIKEVKTKPNVDNFNKNTSSKTKFVFFCNPNNPTGTFINSEVLEEIIELAKEKNIHIVFDESCNSYIYETDKAKLPINITSNNVIRLKSFSKEQNFPGYRLGYLLANKEIISQLKFKVPVLYGNPSNMADRALITEFKIKNNKIKDEEYNKTIKNNIKLMKDNRDFVFKILKSSEFIEEVIFPEACYYIFAKCKFKDGSFKLFEELFHKKHINICPGIIFGMPIQESWIRICFARDKEILQQALNGILSFLEEHNSCP